GSNGRVGRRAEGRSSEERGRRPVGQGSGPGGIACAPRRTRRKDHPGALGKRAEGGSLQPKRATHRPQVAGEDQLGAPVRAPFPPGGEGPTVGAAPLARSVIRRSFLSLRRIT